MAQARLDQGEASEGRQTLRLARERHVAAEQVIGRAEQGLDVSQVPLEAVVDPLEGGETRVAGAPFRRNKIPFRGSFHPGGRGRDPPLADA